MLNAHRYIDENLYDVISKNKDVKFYIVIPAVSNVKLAMNIRDKLPTFAKSADMINYMVKKNNTYSNVEMYAFNE